MSDGADQNDVGVWLVNALGPDVQFAFDDLGQVLIHVAPDQLCNSLRLLRDDHQLAMEQLIDIVAIDYPDRMPRFELVYLLLSMETNLRMNIRTQIHVGSLLPSIVEIFPNANWCEREIFDMYGIEFSGHPDLRRILTDYGFRGYPLRKDFPLTGHVEVRYDDLEKRVVYKPVSLVQEFRDFDYLSSWESMTPKRLPGDEKAGDE